MAKQTVAGPYRVKPTDTGYELVEVVNDELVSLRPERTYKKDKRTSAYRAVALLNREFQLQARLQQIGHALKGVGAGWWSGPHKVKGKYIIHPNSYEPSNDALLDFRSLDALEEWIDQERGRNTKRVQEDKEETDYIRSFYE